MSAGRWRAAAALLWLVLAGADVATTWAALHRPAREGMREGNPTAAWMFAHLGFWPAVALQGCAELVPALLLARPPARLSRVAQHACTAGALVLLVGKLLVVASNVRLLTG